MSNQRILPFPITEKRASTIDYSNLIGTEFHVESIGATDRGAAVVKLVQLDEAAGVTTPLDKLFMASTATGIPDHQVQAVSGTADRVYGIGVTTEALVDNDYFFVQVDGIMSCFMGDDDTDTVIGQLLAADNDTDLGCCYNTGRLIAAALYTDFAISMEVTTAVDTSTLCKPIRKLGW